MHRSSNASYFYSQSFVENSVVEVEKPARLKRASMILQEIPIKSSNIENLDESKNNLQKKSNSNFPPSNNFIMEANDKKSSIISNATILQEIPIKPLSQNLDNVQKSDEIKRNQKKLAAEKVKRNLNVEIKSKTFLEKKLEGKIEKKVERMELKNKESLDEFFEKLTLEEGKAKKDRYSYREVENERLGKTYSRDIIGNLIEKENQDNKLRFLERHNIPANLRAKMIDWMVEVLCSYKCQDQTFFLSVSIMDWFFKKTKTTLEISDLHLIGVTSMFISNKYEEIYPLKLHTLYDKIAHRKLTPDQIKNRERDILDALDYNVLNPTAFEFLTTAFQHLNLKEIVNLKTFEYLEKVCIYLLKMMMHDYSIVAQQSEHELAGACIFVAFKIVEQIDVNFPTLVKTQEMKEFLNLKDEAFYDTAARVLHLAKNFESTYSNLENLKKFNGFSYEVEDDKENKKR